MFIEKATYFDEDETSLFLRGGLSCPMLGEEEPDRLIHTDIESINQLGYTCKMIGQAISDLFARAQKGRLEISGFIVEDHEQIFLPPCPLCGIYEDVKIPRVLEVVALPEEHSSEIYSHAARYGAKFVVGDTRQFAVERGAFLFSKLHPHLIGQHGFFEGQGPYRLAPEKLVPFLKLAQLL